MRALSVLAAGWCLTALALPVEVLRQTGPAANRVDIAVLGDGYTAADQQQLTQDATTLVNALFNASPWKEYAGLFNVKLIKVVSSQTGADYGTYGGIRDTALNAAYGCGGAQRCLSVNDTIVHSLASANTPEYDLALVLVNDPMYGGSGGPVPVASVHPLAAEIVIHELGHSLGQLADEYDSPYPGYPPCSVTSDCPEANATLRTNFTVKWNAWIAPSTPLPTPQNAGYTGIGIFEGARYMSQGVFRPYDFACRMRMLEFPFCSVCQEQMVRTFWSYVSPVDEWTPGATAPVPICAHVTYGVVQPTLAPSTYGYQWKVNGVARDAGAMLTVQPLELGTASVAVELVVTDRTSLVRNDPQRVLEEKVSWNNPVVGSCVPSACDARVSCQADGGCGRQLRAVGSACGPSACAHGQVTASATCDGTGTCLALDGGVTQSCGAYVCDAAGAGCLYACRDGVDCASGYVCDRGECVVPAPDAGALIVLPAANPRYGAPPSGCGCGMGGGPLAWVLLAAVPPLRWRARRR